MEAPLTEAPFHTLTCHLLLDDSYDAIELHEVFGPLHKLWHHFTPPLALLPGRPLSVAVGFRPKSTFFHQNL